MIGIILFIITIAVGIIYALKKSGDGRSIDDPSYFALNIFAIAFFLLIASELTFDIIYSTKALTTTSTVEVAETHNLVTLRDDLETAGSFFLGTGSINNHMYYAFYCETEHGCKYETLSAEKSTVPVYIKFLTSDTEQPYIVKYTIIDRETFVGTEFPVWLSIYTWFHYGKCSPGDIIREGDLLWWFRRKNIIGGSSNYNDNFRYEIYIPEGSIQQDYNIDFD